MRFADKAGKTLDIYDVARRALACRRCHCPCCERGGNENHDHRCVQGKGCIDTREKLLAQLQHWRYVAVSAADEIERLRKGPRL